ncbi:MAG: hypothetical protein RBU30_11850, partial [Polyangia bacterium]|nr:hypothetical protein [Polyangia bacterium]
MRSRRIGLWLTLGTPALLALALAGQAACPFAHDGYETDRPCWDQSDCVTKERCERGDAGILSAGQCSEPSDGPCGFLDGGTSAGFYCFPDEEGNPEKCRYEPNY